MFIRGLSTQATNPRKFFVATSVQWRRKDSVSYDIVYTAGAIIANNRFDGRISASQGGEPRVKAAVGLLTAGSYYCHVPTIDQPYPVMPNSASSRFPHDAGLPAGWQEMDDENVLQELGQGNRDLMAETCRITGRQLALTSYRRLKSSGLVRIVWICMERSAVAPETLSLTRHQTSCG